jgi:endonuclease/exonuclease/phosphatase family metal-dependent hydrolase
VRVIRATVVAALLTTAACASRPPASFDPHQISSLSCRQMASPSAPSVVWISPPGRSEQWRLSRWCETVGAVFFRSQPARPPAAPIDRLAVVSWNVHEGNGDAAALVARLRRGDFTRGEPIDHVVLLLQEVVRRDRTVPARVPPGAPAPRSIVAPHDDDASVSRLADAGFAVLYAPSMRNGGNSRDGRAEDRGNAIVSTLPLDDARLIELPLEHQRRVAAAAAVAGRSSLDTPWRLELVDVHLDTALALSHGGPFAARRRQALSLLDALAGRDRPVNAGAMVLAGDLNTWMGDHEPAVRVLSDAFPGTPAAERAPTWRGPLGVHATLDHIFIRGAVSASPIVRLPSRFGSDHFPLLTIVRF